MRISHRLLMVIMCGAPGFLPEIASGQAEPARMSVAPPGSSDGKIPCTVRSVEGGVEVVRYHGTDRLLRAGDFISWVATPDTNQMARVTSPKSLNHEIASNKDKAGQIALWTQRGAASPAWIILQVPEKAVASRSAGELPEALGGMTLLPGYRIVPRPPGRHGEVWGSIVGPTNLELDYSIWPVAQFGQPRTSGQFVSDAQRLAKEHRQWFREQYIGDELVQIARSNTDRLMVSWPGRGVNLSANVKGSQQLSDAMLIILSIPNDTRGLSWQDAVSVIQHGDLKSVTQLHSLTVYLNMKSGIRYRTTEPRIDEVINVLKKFGKDNDVGVMTE